MEVYCAPWSEWWITLCGRRWKRAIFKADKTNSLCRCVAIAQPTTRQEKSNNENHHKGVVVWLYTREGEPVFLRQIKKMEADLKITQATYDSLNALHTIEVGKLARFGSEQ